MTRALVLTPLPSTPKPEPYQLIQQPKSERKCFGLPRMHTKKCLHCRDFDLCYHHYLSTAKQGRIKIA